MIGDVLLDCDWAGRTLAGFENHAGRTKLDEGALPLGRVVHGFGNDGESGFEGCRVDRAIGTYLHGPLLPKNVWLADRLIELALGIELEPLPGDELEDAAHAAARRAAGV
jgi:CobQ-like glutamine amidotransferase family enzyme